MHERPEYITEEELAAWRGAEHGTPTPPRSWAPLDLLLCAWPLLFMDAGFFFAILGAIGGSALSWFILRDVMPTRARRVVAVLAALALVVGGIALDIGVEVAAQLYSSGVLEQCAS